MSTREILSRWQHLDTAWCFSWNRGVRRRPVAKLLSTVSRLGDGSIWIALIVLVGLLGGDAGRGVSMRMMLVGVGTTLLYKAVKHATGRERPCDAHPELRAPVAPLDTFSFPSGHTMHAVAFTIQAGAHEPRLLLPLLPFTLLVMASRIVLGLHYPSDVLVGAGIGASAAIVAL